MPEAQTQQPDRLSIRGAVESLMEQETDDAESVDQEVSSLSETELEAESDDELDGQTAEADLSEEAEGEDDYEEDAEPLEAEADDGPEEPDIVYDVVLPDGQTVSVADDELVNGYLRQVDYTRKTEQVAEKSRALDQEFAATQEARNRYMAQVQELEQQISTNFGLSDELLRDNPQEYMRRKAAHERVQEERQKMEHEARQEAGRRFQHYVADQHQRMLADPEFAGWKDQQTMAKEKAELRDFALRQGFTQEEIERIVDHRNVKVLRMAMRAEQGEETKRTVAQKKRAKVKPKPKGTRAKRPGPKFTRKVKQAQDNFAKAKRGKSQMNAGVDLLLARQEAAAAKRQRRS